jgi:hypothetical protein
MTNELRICPICGDGFTMPAGRVPSVFSFAAPGQPMRCQITLDGTVRHRCPLVSPRIG